MSWLDKKSSWKLTVVAVNHSRSSRLWQHALRCKFSSKVYPLDSEISATEQEFSCTSTPNTHRKVKVRTKEVCSDLKPRAAEPWRSKSLVLMRQLWNGESKRINRRAVIVEAFPHFAEWVRWQVALFRNKHRRLVSWRPRFPTESTDLINANVIVHLSEQRCALKTFQNHSNFSFVQIRPLYGFCTNPPWSLMLFPVWSQCKCAIYNGHNNYESFKEVLQQSDAPPPTFPIGPLPFHPYVIRTWPRPHTLISWPADQDVTVLF